MTIQELFATLRARGVTELKVPYNGSGDEGWVHPDEAEWTERDDVTEGPVSLDDLFTGNLDELCDGLLEMKYPGYENENGGSGNIVFDVESEEIRFEHEWNVMSTEDDFKTLPLAEIDEALVRKLAPQYISIVKSIETKEG